MVATRNRDWFSIAYAVAERDDAKRPPYVDQAPRPQTVPNSETATTAYWEYFDSGYIKKVSADASSAIGIGYAEELSSPENGIITYRDQYNSVQTLTFDKEGNLVKKTTNNSVGLDTVEFFYKTIEVKASEYEPTIYTNPTGLYEFHIPALTDSDIKRITGNR